MRHAWNFFVGAGLGLLAVIRYGLGVPLVCVCAPLVFVYRLGAERTGAKEWPEPFSVWEDSYRTGLTLWGIAAGLALFLAPVIYEAVTT